MDIKVNSKQFDSILHSVIGIKDLVTRDDEKAILLSIDKSKSLLKVEAVKNQQLQVCLFIPIEFNYEVEQKDVYIQFFQLENLRKVLKDDETLQVFLSNNVLNIKSNSNGTIPLELYNNQSAHESMRLISDTNIYSCLIEVLEWDRIIKKLKSYDNNVFIEFKASSQTVNISAAFENSSFYTFNSKCENLLKDIRFSTEIKKLNFIKSLDNVTFDYDEISDYLIAVGDNGFVIIGNSNITNQEIYTVTELIDLAEENKLCKLTIAQSHLEKALNFQGFKLERTNSISLFQNDNNEFLKVKGEKCEEPASINCMIEGKIQEVDINYSIFNTAVSLSNNSDGGIIDLYQCNLEIEGEDPTIYFIMKEEISPELKLESFFYSIPYN